MAGPPLGRSGSVNKDKAAMLAADDAKRMQALESKVTEQKKELENRDITIRAIQRNFEQLSSMCQADKEQIAALQKKLAEADKRTMSAEQRELLSKFDQSLRGDGRAHTPREEGFFEGVRRFFAGW